MNRLLHILLLAAASLAAFPALCGGYDRAYEVSMKAIALAQERRGDTPEFEISHDPRRAISALADSIDVYIGKGWDVDAFMCAGLMYSLQQEHDIKFDKKENLRYLRGLIANRGPVKLYKYVESAAASADSADREFAFEALYYLSRIYNDLNKVDKSVEAIERTVPYIDNDGQRFAYLLRKAYAARDTYDMIEFNELMGRLEEMAKPGSSHYLDYLNAKAYQDILYGRSDELENRLRAVETAADIKGRKSMTWLNYANRLFTAYIERDDYEKADALLGPIIDCMEANAGHASMFEHAFNIGGLMERRGDVRGLELMEEAFRSRNSIIARDRDSASFASYLASVYYEPVYYEHKDVAKALEYESWASALLYQLHGPGSSLLLVSYGNKLIFQLANELYKEAGKSAVTLLGIYRENLMRMFGTMNVKERFELIGTDRYRASLGHLIPFMSICGFVETGASYDAALLYKGILLATEADIRKNVENSGDDSLKANYAEYCAIMRRLDQLNLESDKAMRDALGARADSLGRVLARDSRQISASLSPVSMHWNDVGYRLKKGEVAVEFVEGHFMGRSAYGAFCVTDQYDKPQRIFFGTDEDINAVSPEEYYTSSKLYDLVWKPILEAYPKAKKIYFSPSGKFNDIAIEHVPDSAGVPVGERPKLYRLSSTRILADIRGAEADSAARIGTASAEVALFGGINYYPDEEEFIAAMPDGAAERGAVGSGIDKRSLGSAVPFLPGTLREVSDIADMLGAKGSAAQMYLNAEGSEERFKALSGKGITHLHVATHGFYQPGTGQGSEDTMLDRTGLLMAGAGVDMTEFGSDMPLDDGILTAAEIARMDLDGLDLVVLSACESALGDSGSDGVFGLQRGFKKAGARSILMAVDKVDDNATRILMHSFYRNLLDGHGKAESLAIACRELRRTENGRYDSPRYWAPFIILDAID